MNLRNVFNKTETQIRWNINVESDMRITSSNSEIDFDPEWPSSPLQYL